MLRRESKLAWLADRQKLSAVQWKSLSPDVYSTWLVPENKDEFAAFLPVGGSLSKRLAKSDMEAVFAVHCRGLETTRDAWVYDFQREPLIAKVSAFIETYNSEVDRWKRAREPKDVDSFVANDEKKIKWSSRLKETLGRGKYAEFSTDKIRIALYRPFCKQLVFFDAILNQRQGQFRTIFPTPAEEHQNIAIAFTDIGYRAPDASTLIANCITDLHLCAAVDAHQCFPFYVYDEDGSNRRENITDWALQQFRQHYGDDAIGKWDIFHYVYGVLHHPGYRTKFADNLKRELPRIPFAPDFRAFASAGKELSRLHLDYEKLEPYPLTWLETPGVPLSYRVADKMRLSKDKTTLIVNPSLTLSAIPPEALQYRLGNRSALEWVIDQYQVSEDKRSGIRSDPNRADDPEYIVRLVGQVVRVSIETVRIVAGLPAKVCP